VNKLEVKEAYTVNDVTIPPKAELHVYELQTGEKLVVAPEQEVVIIKGRVYHAINGQITYSSSNDIFFNELMKELQILPNGVGKDLVVSFVEISHKVEAVEKKPKPATSVLVQVSRLGAEVLSSLKDMLEKPVQPQNQAGQAQELQKTLAPVIKRQEQMQAAHAVVSAVVTMQSTNPEKPATNLVTYTRNSQGNITHVTVNAMDRDSHPINVTVPVSSTVTVQDEGLALKAVQTELDVAIIREQARMDAVALIPQVRASNDMVILKAMVRLVEQPDPQHIAAWKVILSDNKSGTPEQASNNTLKYSKGDVAVTVAENGNAVAVDVGAGQEMLVKPVVPAPVALANNEFIRKAMAAPQQIQAPRVQVMTINEQPAVVTYNPNSDLKIFSTASAETYSLNGQPVTLNIESRFEPTESGKWIPVNGVVAESSGSMIPVGTPVSSEGFIYTAGLNNPSAVIIGDTILPRQPNGTYLVPKNIVSALKIQVLEQSSGDVIKVDAPVFEASIFAAYKPSNVKTGAAVQKIVKTFIEPPAPIAANVPELTPPGVPEQQNMTVPIKSEITANEHTGPPRSAVASRFVPPAVTQFIDTVKTISKVETLLNEYPAISSEIKDRIRAGQLTEQDAANEDVRKFIVALSSQVDLPTINRIFAAPDITVDQPQRVIAKLAELTKITFTPVQQISLQEKNTAQQVLREFDPLGDNPVYSQDVLNAIKALRPQRRDYSERINPADITGSSVRAMSESAKKSKLGVIANFNDWVWFSYYLKKYKDNPELFIHALLLGRTLPLDKFAELRELLHSKNGKPLPTAAEIAKFIQQASEIIPDFRKRERVLDQILTFIYRSHNVARQIMEMAAKAGALIGAAGLLVSKNRISRELRMVLNRYPKALLLAKTEEERAQLKEKLVTWVKQWNEHFDFAMINDQPEIVWDSPEAALKAQQEATGRQAVRLDEEASHAQEVLKAYRERRISLPELQKQLAQIAGSVTITETPEQEKVRLAQYYAIYNPNWKPEESAPVLAQASLPLPEEKLPVDSGPTFVDKMAHEFVLSDDGFNLPKTGALPVQLPTAVAAPGAFNTLKNDNAEQSAPKRELSPLLIVQRQARAHKYYMDIRQLEQKLDSDKLDEQEKMTNILCEGKIPVGGNNSGKTLASLVAALVFMDEGHPTMYYLLNDTDSVKFRADEKPDQNFTHGYADLFNLLSGGRYTVVVMDQLYKEYKELQNKALSIGESKQQREQNLKARRQVIAAALANQKVLKITSVKERGFLPVYFAEDADIMNSVTAMKKNLAIILDEVDRVLSEEMRFVMSTGGSWTDNPEMTARVKEIKKMYVLVKPELNNMKIYFTSEEFKAGNKAGEFGYYLKPTHTPQNGSINLVFTDKVYEKFGVVKPNKYAQKSTAQADLLEGVLRNCIEPEGNNLRLFIEADGTKVYHIINSLGEPQVEMIGNFTGKIVKSLRHNDLHSDETPIDINKIKYSTETTRENHIAEIFETTGNGGFVVGSSATIGGAAMIKAKTGGAEIDLVSPSDVWEDRVNNPKKPGDQVVVKYVADKTRVGDILALVESALRSNRGILITVMDVALFQELQARLEKSYAKDKLYVIHNPNDLQKLEEAKAKTGTGPGSDDVPRITLASQGVAIGHNFPGVLDLVVGDAENWSHEMQTQVTARNNRGNVKDGRRFMLFDSERVLRMLAAIKAELPDLALAKDNQHFADFERKAGTLLGNDLQTSMTNEHLELLSDYLQLEQETAQTRHYIVTTLENTNRDKFMQELKKYCVTINRYDIVEEFLPGLTQKQVETLGLKWAKTAGRFVPEGFATEVPLSFGQKIVFVTDKKGFAARLAEIATEDKWTKDQIDGFQRLLDNQVDGEKLYDHLQIMGFLQEIGAGVASVTAHPDTINDQILRDYPEQHGRIMDYLREAYRNNQQNRATYDQVWAAIKTGKYDLTRQEMLNIGVLTGEEQVRRLHAESVKAVVRMLEALVLGMTGTAKKKVLEYLSVMLSMDLVGPAADVIDLKKAIEENNSKAILAGLLKLGQLAIMPSRILNVFSDTKAVQTALVSAEQMPKYISIGQTNNIEIAKNEIFNPQDNKIYTQNSAFEYGFDPARPIAEIVEKPTGSNRFMRKEITPNSNRQETNILHIAGNYTITYTPIEEIEVDGTKSKHLEVTKAVPELGIKVGDYVILQPVSHKIYNEESGEVTFQGIPLARLASEKTFEVTLVYHGKTLRAAFYKDAHTTEWTPVKIDGNDLDIPLATLIPGNVKPAVQLLGAYTLTEENGEYRLEQRQDKDDFLIGHEAYDVETLAAALISAIKSNPQLRTDLIRSQNKFLAEIAGYFEHEQVPSEDIILSAVSFVSGSNVLVKANSFDLAKIKREYGEEQAVEHQDSLPLGPTYKLAQGEISTSETQIVTEDGTYTSLFIVKDAIPYYGIEPHDTLAPVTSSFGNILLVFEGNTPKLRRAFVQEKGQYQSIDWQTNIFNRQAEIVLSTKHGVKLEVGVDLENVRNPADIRKPSIRIVGLEALHITDHDSKEEVAAVAGAFLVWYESHRQEIAYGQNDVLKDLYRATENGVSKARAEDIAKMVLQYMHQQAIVAWPVQNETELVTAVLARYKKLTQTLSYGIKQTIRIISDNLHNLLVTIVMLDVFGITASMIGQDARDARPVNNKPVSTRAMDNPAVQGPTTVELKENADKSRQLDQQAKVPVNKFDKIPDQEKALPLQQAATQLPPQGNNLPPTPTPIPPNPIGPTASTNPNVWQSGPGGGGAGGYGPGFQVSLAPSFSGVITWADVLAFGERVKGMTDELIASMSGDGGRKSSAVSSSGYRAEVIGQEDVANTVLGMNGGARNTSGAQLKKVVINENNGFYALALPARDVANDGQSGKGLNTNNGSATGSQISVRGTAKTNLAQVKNAGINNNKVLGSQTTGARFVKNGWTQAKNANGNTGTVVEGQISTQVIAQTGLTQVESTGINNGSVSAGLSVEQKNAKTNQANNEALTVDGSRSTNTVANVDARSATGALVKNGINSTSVELANSKADSSNTYNLALGNSSESEVVGNTVSNVALIVNGSNRSVRTLNFGTENTNIPTGASWLAEKRNTVPVSVPENSGSRQAMELPVQQVYSVANGYVNKLGWIATNTRQQELHVLEIKGASEVAQGIVRTYTGKSGFAGTTGNETVTV
ncbi:MAG: hypothetical protein WCI27_05490, partial [Candidatus Omnitrophota bacterium]